MRELTGEYHEDCNRLIFEINQLKAQINRFKTGIEVMSESGIDELLYEIDDETPAQSLLINNADVLEEYAKALPQVSTDYITDNDYLMDAMDCSEWMIQEANALRNQAKENKQ